METETQSAVSATTNDNATTTAAKSILATATVESKTQEQQVQQPVSVPRAEKFNDLIDADGKFLADWTHRLPEQLAEYTKTLGKFKSPTELMQSYAQLEKEFSKRASEKIKIPAEDASEEEWNNYKQAIGAPMKPEDYGLSKPDNVDDAQWDATTAETAASIAAKYGVPKKALDELVGVYNESIKNIAVRAEEYQQQQMQTVVAELKREMGASFNSNIQRAARAATALGLDPNDASIGNNAQIIKALIRVDELMGEDKNLGKAVATTETYQEQYNRLLKSDDYLGKNGVEKQMKAHEKIKDLFAAMNR